MTYGKFKLTRTHEVTCDQCGNWTDIQERTADGAERRITRAGWRVVNGEVLCKHCAARVKKSPKICNLRVVRKAKGLTLQACADLLDSHIRTISGWEQGRHAPADAAWIAARLGVPVEELYADPA